MSPLRRFRPYPSYKDSGVDWLGPIPAHWDIRRLKHIAAVRPSGVDKHTTPGERAVRLCNYTNVYRHERITADMDFMAATASPGEIQRMALRRGDVVVTKDSETWEDIAVPAVIAEDIPDLVCGYHLALIRPNAAWVSGPYLHRAFQARNVNDQYRVAACGVTRFALSSDALATAIFPVPPIDEQPNIAAFLDRETARIDVLVAKKERLIELLQERRTALISSAVTMGLDPTVPTRDSGVDWLGRVPAHWDVTRIKWAARMVSGHTPDKKVDSYWQGGDIPWVSLADTATLREVDYIETTAAMTTADGIAHSSAHVLPAGTVVFSRDATVGLCAITRAGMAVSQHFIGWVCGPRLQPEYLLFVLRSMTQELERLTMGATISTIGMSDVRSLVTPIPPRVEQEAIVREVLRRREHADVLISKVREAIVRLKELRTALISAAVTGKIDVQEEVA